MGQQEGGRTALKSHIQIGHGWGGKSDGPIGTVTVHIEEKGMVQKCTDTGTVTDKLV